MQKKDEHSSYQIQKQLKCKTENYKLLEKSAEEHHLCNLGIGKDFLDTMSIA